MNQSDDNYPAVLDAVVRALMDHDRGAAGAHMASIVFTDAAVTPRRTPTIGQLALIYEHDRYHCRYCGGKTILTPVMRLISVAFPKEFPYHKNWTTTETHPAVGLRSATLDHLVPVARGGDPLDRDNIVTACWVCNQLKGDLPVSVIGWKLREPADPHWHGLANLYHPLWEALGQPQLGKDESRWRRVTREMYGNH